MAKEPTSTASATDRIKDLQDRIKKEIEDVGIQLAKELAIAAKTAAVLKSIDGKIDIWEDPQYGEQLTTLGLVSVAEAAKIVAPKKSKGPRGSHPKATEEAIMAFIGEEEKPMKELRAHFGQTVSKKIAPLVSSKTLTERKDGISLFYRKHGKK